MITPGDVQYSTQTEWTSGVIGDRTTIAYSDQLGVNSVLETLSLQVASHCGEYSGGGENVATLELAPNKEYEGSRLSLEVQYFDGVTW